MSNFEGIWAPLPKYEHLWRYMSTLGSIWAYLWYMSKPYCSWKLIPGMHVVENIVKNNSALKSYTNKNLAIRMATQWKTVNRAKNYIWNINVNASTWNFFLMRVKCVDYIELLKFMSTSEVLCNMFLICKCCYMFCKNNVLGHFKIVIRYFKNSITYFFISILTSKC